MLHDSSNNRPFQEIDLPFQNGDGSLAILCVLARYSFVSNEEMKQYHAENRREGGTFTHKKSEPAKTLMHFILEKLTFCD